jgi:hypothetical protein
MLMAGLSAVEESPTSGFSHPYDRSVEMEQSSREAVSKEIHRFEFVALAAMLMAMAALGMDTMLVALPDIARTFRVIEENDRQLIVTTYLLGIAAGQPLYGPLSDRFGRKPVLAAGLAIFVLGSLLAFLAPSFGGNTHGSNPSGLWSGFSPGTGDGDRSRSFFGSRHGKDDVLCHDDLHHGADLRSDDRCGNPPSPWPLALDLRFPTPYGVSRACMDDPSSSGNPA